MRWLFLLLLMLNGFYYIWHQQEAPLRAKEVLPLSLHRAENQNIQLLNEVDSRSGREVDEAGSDVCLFLGGFARESEAVAVAQRLTSLDVRSDIQSIRQGGANVFWLRIDPVSRRLVGDNLVSGLAQDFPELKKEIMLCSGIATSG